MKRTARTKEKTVKLFLHHANEDVESGPAVVVGKAARGLVPLRLRFIPFFFACPTYDDVVLAKKDPELEGHWTFEVPFSGGMEETDLHEHGGRYALIFDYRVGGAHTGPWFPGREDIVSANATAPKGERPGRVYLAVPSIVKPPEVMQLLAEGHPDFQFSLVHPKPRKKRRR